MEPTEDRTHALPESRLLTDNCSEDNSVTFDSSAITLRERDLREVFSELPSSPPRIKREKINGVDEIVGREFSEDRIYETKEHREIYSILLRQLKNLVGGKYRNTKRTGTQGVCTSIVVGAKGIGKSACLKNFNQLAKYIQPNVW